MNGRDVEKNMSRVYKVPKDRREIMISSPLISILFSRSSSFPLFVYPESINLRTNLLEVNFFYNPLFSAFSYAYSKLRSSIRVVTKSCVGSRSRVLHLPYLFINTRRIFLLAPTLRAALRGSNHKFFSSGRLKKTIFSLRFDSSINSN